MSAFNDINGIPASAHPFLLKDLLRGQWNFNGFVVSDWEAVKQLVAQGVAEDDKDATRLAFNSGIDMDMTDGLYNKYMKYHNNFSNINRKMHASSKMFLFSYLMQDVPDGDGAPTMRPWNMPSLHRRLVYKIYNLKL